MHLCAGLTAASWIVEPFGESGGNFSLQLSSRIQFAKISNKTVIAKKQCELEFRQIALYFGTPRIYQVQFRPENTQEI